MRGRSVGSVLALLFVAVPLLEIYVIIQVGQVIGAWWTVLVLVADSLFGAYLVRREGRRAWTALREALDSRRMPARELADRGLVLVGGTLLLTPGFVTDAVGLFVILPLTRPLARGVLTRVITRRFVVLGSPPPRRGDGSGDSAHPRHSHPTTGSGGPDSVVPGEVVD